MIYRNWVSVSSLSKSRCPFKKSVLKIDLPQAYQKSVSKIGLAYHESVFQNWSSLSETRVSFFFTMFPVGRWHGLRHQWISTAYFFNVGPGMFTRKFPPKKSSWAGSTRHIFSEIWVEPALLVFPPKFEVSRPNPIFSPVPKLSQNPYFRGFPSLGWAGSTHISIVWVQPGLNNNGRAICQNCRFLCPWEFNTLPFLRRLKQIWNTENINIAQPTGIPDSRWAIMVAQSMCRVSGLAQLNKLKMWKKVVLGGLSVWTLAGCEWRAAAAELAARPGGYRNSHAGWQFLSGL